MQAPNKMTLLRSGGTVLRENTQRSDQIEHIKAHLSLIIKGAVRGRYINEGYRRRR